MSLATITSLRRNLSEWAERPANQKFLHRDQEDLLVRSLGQPGRDTQVQVAAWMLGTWHLGHGFVRVFDGDGRGFDEARQGQALRRCSLLLRARHQQTKHRGTARLPFSQLQASLTVLLGLALHDPGAEPLYELVRRQPDAAFDDEAHLPLFVRELLTLRAGERPVVTLRLGPWHDVLVHWNGDPRLFAQKVAHVLDLHLQQVRGKGAPFDDPACQLFPLEALAIRHVRDWLDLPTPKFDHPLMFTNLVTMTPDPTWPDHELVQLLEALLRRR
jgi:hypothetical protein